MASMWILDFFSSSTQLLLLFLITFLPPFFIRKWLEERKYPPGPIGLPLFGYLPFLGEEPYKKLWELSKKYGNIISIYMGPNRTVIINDCKMAKEALAHPAALARPEISPELTAGNGGFGILNGEMWTEQRRFVMHTMRDLGLGRGVWENVIQEYAEVFVNELKKWKGEPASFKELLEISQASNILALLIGRRLPTDKYDPETQLLLQTISADNAVSAASSVSLLAPFLIKYLIKLPISKYYKYAKVFRKFESLVRTEIEKRIKTKSSEGANDFISHYLQEIEKLENVDKVHNFNVDSLTGSVSNLLTAGTDTTSSSIYWLLLLMATFPDIQKRIQEEIDNTVGREKRIYWDERTKLPYTTAAIMEMERWITLTPLAPPRLAMDSFPIGGYTIPKGSFILCNFWAIMRDPGIFKDPHNYRPEHFLTKDEKTLVKPESYLAFSFGKRNCPGETIAMMSIFIYFVSIMQKFTVKTTDGKPANFETNFAITIIPKYPQKLCFIER